MSAGTSGFGASSATSSSIWRFDLCVDRGQDLFAVLVREVGREKRDAAQVETTIAEHREEQRVLPCGASDGDSEVRLGFREVQDLDAIREHRRASFSGIKPAVIDFSDMGNEVGLDPPRLLHDLREMAEQFVIRK